MSKRWIGTSFLFLFLIAMIGTLLRGASYITFPFSFEFLRHAHSHVAFQGWVYTLMMVILTNNYIEAPRRVLGRYVLQIIITYVVIVGILISFALQGYAFYSIFFSSIFQLLNYWFIFRFFKDTSDVIGHRISLRWIKTGLVLGLISSIAPWFIGVVSANGMNGSELYNALIYFFLHFQYNGWFLFVVIGLLFDWMEEADIKITETTAQWFYWLWTLAVIPAYLLSLLGMSFADWIRIPALIGAVLQLIALRYFIPTVWINRHSLLGKKNFWVGMLLFMAFLAFLMKVLLQGISVLPPVQHLAFDSRNIVMAYMHLSLIGVLTFFYLAWLLDHRWLPSYAMTNLGLLLLVAGFCVSEIILVVSGLGWWRMPFVLFIFSGIMMLGIGVLVLSIFLKINNHD